MKDLKIALLPSSGVILISQILRYYTYIAVFEIKMPNLRIKSSIFNLLHKVK